jgi:hypothetical protein
MSEAEGCRIKSEAYLQRAMKTADLDERGRLLSLAVYWNEQARVMEMRLRAQARKGR